MKARRAPAGPESGSSFVGEVEGYLKAQTYYLEAREEAYELCARMPWLTSAQAEEMTRHYVEENIRRTRHTLIRHIDDLRTQYEGRYQRLRSSLAKRYTAVTLVVVAGLTGINAGACLLLR